MVSYNLALLAVCIILLIILYYFIQSYRFQKNGIRTKAVITLIQKVEEASPDGGEERNIYATIEYSTEEDIKKTSKIRIGRKYLKEEYRNNLPIIYRKESSGRPIIENAYNIYKQPIDLVVLVVILIITLVLIAKGLEVNVLI